MSLVDFHYPWHIITGTINSKLLEFFGFVGFVGFIVFVELLCLLGSQLNNPSNSITQATLLSFDLPPAFLASLSNSVVFVSLSPASLSTHFPKGGAFYPCLRQGFGRQAMGPLHIFSRSSFITENSKLITQNWQVSHFSAFSARDNSTLSSPPVISVRVTLKSKYPKPHRSFYRGQDVTPHRLSPKSSCGRGRRFPNRLDLPPFLGIIHSVPKVIFLLKP